MKFYLFFLAFISIRATGMNRFNILEDVRTMIEGRKRIVEDLLKKERDELEKIIDNRINKREKFRGKPLDLNAKIICGVHHQSPLHRAVHCDKTGELAKRLLEAGANPNVIDPDGKTPLHIACDEHSVPNIQLLLRYGSQPNAVSNCLVGNTPLHKVVHEALPLKNMEIDPFDQTEKEKAIRLLLAYGANPLQPDGLKKTCLQIAYNPATLALLKRTFYHKKQAYLWFLRGKSDQNPSTLRRLPSDVIKIIIDSIRPGYQNFPWPQEQIPVGQMIGYLQSIPE